MNNALMTETLKKEETNYTEAAVTCALDGAELTALLQTTMKGDGSIICWQMNRIIWGRWQEGRLTLSDGSPLVLDYVLELRVFNTQEELHLVKAGNYLNGRYLCDGDGTGRRDYVDSMSPLWGNKSEAAADGYVTLTDMGRKLNMTIPCREISVFYGLVTRSYIGVSEQTGQAGYVDYRFVAVAPEKGGM